MIRRSTAILIEAIIGVLAGLALLAGMAIWRLSAGPVRVDFLTPYLEAAFAETESGLSVEVGETVLSWEGWSRTLDLRARQVGVMNASGDTVALFPDVSITLSLQALVRGVVAPTEIEIVDARLSLLRGPGGRFRLLTRGEPEYAETPDEEQEFSAIVPALIDLFLEEPDPDRPLGYLKAVRVVDGQLIVIDRRLDTVWLAPAANMELRRHPAGIAAFMGLQVAIGEDLANANLAVLFDAASETTTVAAKLSDVRADALAAVLPVPDELAGFRVPLEANINGALSPDGLLTHVTFDVVGGRGDLTIPSLLPKTHPVSRFSLRAVLDGPADRLEIEGAELQFGSDDTPGPLLSLSGRVDGLDGDMAIAAEANLRGLPANELGDFWPAHLSRGGRAWALEHIRHGSATSGHVSVAATVPGGDFDAVEVERVRGGFEFEGLTVYYITSMPPVTAVRGDAVFDGDALRFRITEGKVGDLRLSKTKVDLLDLTGSDPWIEIGGIGAGPLRATLEILDHEELNLLDRIGIKPDDAEGRAETALSFRFPLEDDLALEEIDLSAEAKVTEGSVRGFLLQRDASEMTLDLAVDRKSMEVRGPLKLAGVPADMDWREDFTGQAEQRTLLQFNFPNVDSVGRRDLGLDFAPYVEGPVSASMVASIKRGGTGEVNVAANLARAHVSLPFLHWDKSPDIDGEIRLTMTMQDEEITAVDRFDLEAGTLLARGRAKLLEDRFDFRRLDFDQLAFHGTTLRGVSVVREGDRLFVDLGKGVLDADAFLNDDEAAAERIAEKEGAPEEDKSPLQITGRDISSVYFGAGRFLENVDLDLVRAAKGWVNINMQGKVPKELWARRRNGVIVEPEGAPATAKTFTLTFGPSGKGDYRLIISMNDMGAALRALDVIDTVEGGNLVITANSPGPAPHHQVIGRIQAEDYIVQDAPVMAQLLSLASLSGIGNVLSGDGLRFKRLVGQFQLEHGVVETDLIRAYGAALGLTAKGELDFVADRIALRGTVVPAYTVNRILGEIPVLGPILTGGEGEGVLAVTYQIDGSIGDPQVSVNALSALTPGFLRALFGMTGEGEVGQDARPAAFPPVADK